MPFSTKLSFSTLFHYFFTYFVASFNQKCDICTVESAHFMQATGLANELKVSRNDISTYLLYMEKAGMIGQLRDETGGMRGLGKTDNVYLDNPNLIYALSGDHANIGNIRETFFYNQTRLTEDVITSKVSDFTIGKYTFEVGGAKKSHKQIKNVPHSYVVRDDVEYANGDILPLWSFGLLY